MAKSKKKNLGSKPITLNVKFLETCRDGEFRAGEVYELKAPSAYHWMKRGLAIEVKKTVKKSPAKRKPGRPRKQPVKASEVKVESAEKKTEESMPLPSSTPPITVTDPTPELEKAPNLEEK